LIVNVIATGPGPNESGACRAVAPAEADETIVVATPTVLKKSRLETWCFLRDIFEEYAGRNDFRSPKFTTAEVRRFSEVFAGAHPAYHRKRLLNGRRTIV
jgi:hypothetical protein